MFSDIKEIEDLLMDVRVVNWSDVFPIYSENESKKRSQNERDEWLKRVEDSFASKNWIVGRIKVGKLFLVIMSSAGWIRKFACSMSNCQDYEIKDECIHCDNPLLATFTLEDVVNNYNLEGKCPSRFDENHIVPIKNEIKRGNMNDKLFVIIENTSPPFVMDGNSRLISMATLPDMRHEEILCFIGYKRDR